MTRRHSRFKVLGTPVTQLKLVDLGEVTKDPTGAVSTGKFEIISTGKFEIVVEDESPPKPGKK
jgi:hypothetical protein